MIFILVVTTLMAGTIFTGCQSLAQKQKAAQDKVQDARQDLNAARKNANEVAQKAATAEEWKTFNKSNFELKIEANEMRITKLNVKIRKPAELFDAFYLQKIANLEKENRFLKSRLDAYEKSQRNLGSN